MKNLMLVLASICFLILVDGSSYATTGDDGVKSQSLCKIIGVHAASLYEIKSV